MIVLDNAGTRALSLINTQNGANVEVNFSDYTTTTGVYARGVPTLTTISSGTTTSVCATPAASTIRDIDYVNIYNTYAGSQNFTVQITSGSGGPFILVFVTLAQNESLNYTHGTGWCALDANGNRKVSLGTILASLTVTGNATIGGTLGVTGATTLSAALTYGGVTLTNAVTGTGKMVLDTSPVLVTPALGTPSSGNLASCTGYVGTSALVTVGALNSGSITSGFGSIDVGVDSISGGAISGATGTFTKTIAGDVITFTNAAASNKTGYLYSDATYVGLMNIAGAGAGEGWLIGNSGHIYGQIGGSTKLDVSSTGLAVTGTLSASGIGGIGAATSSTTNLNLAAGTTGVSTLRIPHGSAPSAPVDGDMWTTTAGLYIRINGGTVGPLS